MCVRLRGNCVRRVASEQLEHPKGESRRPAGSRLDPDRAASPGDDAMTDSKSKRTKRALGAAFAGILAGSALAMGCSDGVEAAAGGGTPTEANGCNGPNGCAAEANAASGARATHAEANGCNGPNGCGGESESESEAGR
jgi:hypothetical protein